MQRSCGNWCGYAPFGKTGDNIVGTKSGELCVAIAVDAALKDAGVNWKQIQGVAAGAHASQVARAGA